MYTCGGPVKIFGFLTVEYPKIDQLIQKGVVIPNPESVEIGDDIKVENISSDRVIIHVGVVMNFFAMGETLLYNLSWLYDILPI